MATRIFILGILATASIALASVHIDLRPPSNTALPVLRHAETEIEFRYEPEGELSLLLRTLKGESRSQLMTFPVDATVYDLVHSSLGASLLGGAATCSLVDTVSQKPFALHSKAGPLLREHEQDVRMKCHLQKMKKRHAHVHEYTFYSYVAPKLAPNEVRSRNQLRRELIGEQQQYPLNSAEMLSETWQGVVGWAESFIKYHWGALHEFPDYTRSTTQTGRWHLNTGAVLQEESVFGAESDADIRIAIAADWAAGTMESDYVQQVMMQGNGTAYNPHWTIHVGDVYYVGAAEYVNSNCLGIAPPGVARGVTWPHGSLGSFAVEGNHEVYARATGFFDTFLPTLGVTDPLTGKPQGQEAGFVSMENRYWRVILLDTGYGTYDLIPKNDNRNNTQPQAVIDWLVNVVDISNPSDPRGIIFLTHHQVESAFEEPYQATPNQIAALMPPNRTVLWLWGHEHRLAFYKMFTLPNATVPMNVYGRCIGNSGFPASVGPIPPRAEASGLVAYDDRLYQLETGYFNTSVSYNGFTRMTLSKNSATLTYSSLATDPNTGELSNQLQTDLVQEMFQVDENGNVLMSDFAIIDPEMTVIKSSNE